LAELRVALTGDNGCLERTMETRRIVIDVPEEVLSAVKTDEETFRRELVMRAALKLDEVGRLGSGWAADLAGVPRVEFLLALGRYQVFSLEADLAELEALHA
jgi:hypothetical protein